MHAERLFDSGELAAILREEPDRAGMEVQSAAQGNRLDVLEFVLRHEPSQWHLDVALAQAAGRRGHVEYVRMLLAAGAQPGAERDEFALWAAAAVGDAETVRLLLDADADPDMRTDDYGSPDGCRLALVAAVRAGAYDVVAALLDGGADPNVLTDALTRPLDVAVAEPGGEAVAALLRARGARVFAPEEADFLQAAKRGFVARVQELLPEQDAAAVGRALVVAVQERQVEVAVAILEGGGVGSDDLGLALGQAIAFDAPQVVPYLIAAGVDVDAPANYYRRPPLVLAAERGRVLMVRDLLAAGADVGARDEDGRNALAVARERGGLSEIVQLLRAAGASARTPQQIIRAAKAKLAPTARLAWSPVLGPADGERALGGSRFGGLPWLGEGEAWPLCGECAAPLAFFVQLDLAAVPRQARDELGTGLLQLFHCTGCNPSRAFSRGHLVRIVGPAEVGRPTPPPTILPSEGAVPFPERPITGWARGARDYPYREADESDLLPEERAVVFGLNRQGDKLGGWPNWVQDAEYPHCPLGDQRMTRPVFQIDSRRGVPHTWGDHGAGYIVQCPAHRDQVAFLWQSG
ncbi:ankyrin repeat domain-containing protein [Yinghuangia sp. YIM S09857]|uniref:ankyrin repeat domain-containing protein n=1 Tax=Yinghuangia sp. YIM S09857 TaxID=3436929 RepID=UPI003F5355E4